jgi:hypothetical protein
VKKILVPVVLAVAALAIPAYAGAHGGKPPSPGKSDTPHGNSHKCKPHNVGFIVTGTLVSTTLSQTAGQATPSDTSDDRYSGDVTLTVTHTNHHAKGMTGQQTITLTNVRAEFGTGVNAASPAAGTVVHLIGKLPVVSKKCQSSSSPAAPTFRKANFEQPSSPAQS